MALKQRDLHLAATRALAALCRGTTFDEHAALVEPAYLKRVWTHVLWSGDPPLLAIAETALEHLIRATAGTSIGSAFVAWVLDMCYAAPHPWTRSIAFRALSAVCTSPTDDLAPKSTHDHSDAGAKGRAKQGTGPHVGAVREQEDSTGTKTCVHTKQTIANLISPEECMRTSTNVFHPRISLLASAPRAMPRAQKALMAAFQADRAKLLPASHTIDAMLSS